MYFRFKMRIFHRHVSFRGRNKNKSTVIFHFLPSLDLQTHRALTNKETYASWEQNLVQDSWISSGLLDRLWHFKAKGKGAKMTVVGLVEW